MTAAQHIAVLLPSLDGGGAERSVLTLVGGFLARGRRVDLLVCRAKGALLEEVPPGARLRELTAAGALGGRLLAARLNPADLPALLRPVLLAKKNAPEIARIGALRDYLDEERPDAVLSALTYANLTAIWARRGSRSRPPLVVSERNALATYCAAPHKHRKWRFRYLPELVRRSYPEADTVVAVSDHVAGELSGPVGLAHPRLLALPNPVVDDTLAAAARRDPGHPWFEDGGPPVVLGAGRLAEQKDFATLLRAFARLRASRELRLVILGEGDLRGELEAQAGRLGVAEDVDLTGFVSNPFAFMARGAAFALSSTYEGLPGVLIQAMACGCPVVSTNCPGGSAEILQDGELGPLVPVGDDAALAGALAGLLDTPPDAGALARRAADFSVGGAVDAYLEVLDGAAERGRPGAM